MELTGIERLKAKNAEELARQSSRIPKSNKTRPECSGKYVSRESPIAPARISSKKRPFFLDYAGSESPANSKNVFV